MPFHPRGSNRPSRAGAKSAYDRQVSRQGRQLLAWLVKQQQQLTSPEARLELSNQGIPWRASEAATALDALVPSITRTLSGLERRRLIFCWATGEGKGRRVSHVKLTWAAEELAAQEEKMGMSIHQAARQSARAFRERMEWIEANSHSYTHDTS